MYRYQKVKTPYTTITAEYSDVEGYFEHGTINGWTYIFLPDVYKPEIPDGITQFKSIASLNVTQKAVYDTTIIKQLKKISPHIKLLNQRVKEKIAEEYDLDSQIKILRRKDRDALEFQTMNEFIESCRAWGQEQKALMGFITE
jgi:hypothetical protein